MKACSVDGCQNWAEGRGMCHTHYMRWYRRHTVLPPPPLDGLGVCECRISRPNPKCCTVCGFPCVHRMASRIRALALEKMPVLARQVIDRGVRSVA
jgi:hypothetical protein